MAQDFGVLPHQLLDLDMDEFNFNLMVMYFANKQEEELNKKVEKEAKDEQKNKFSLSKGGNQPTQTEFEQALNVTE